MRNFHNLLNLSVLIILIVVVASPLEGYRRELKRWKRDEVWKKPPTKREKEPLRRSKVMYKQEKLKREAKLDPKQGVRQSKYKDYGEEQRELRIR